jgi:hypothetical protein
MSRKMVSLEPRTMGEAVEFAERIARSGLVPDQYQGKPNNVLVAVQWGYELGLAPMQALQNISVINGRPSVWGDSQVALVKAHPAYRGLREWQEGDTAHCEVKRELPGGEIEVTVRSFSLEQARKAKLLNRPTWQSYPDRMLQMRARGFALRDAFPDALKGLLSVEEAQDYPDAEPIDITPPPDIVKSVPTKAETSEELVNAITQNSQDDAEVVNIEDISEPGADEVQLEPEDDDGEEKLYLYFPDPDKPPMGFWFEDEYADAYNDLMLQMVRCGLKPEEKRTKLKELEQANEKTMARFNDQAVIKELKDKRIQYNKGLSIEAKEQTDG